MKLNVVMIVKNEERCLARCLRQARSLADRLILADTGSTDRTKEIAKAYGAEIFDYPWQEDFSKARNFALSQSDGDWNLVLDADEALRPADRRELEEHISRISEKYGKNWIGGIERFDTWQKNGQTEISCSRLPRLLPSGVTYTGKIHEQPQPLLPVILLPLVADHDGYLQEGKGIRNLSYLQKAIQEEPQEPYYQFQMAVTLRNLGLLGESLIWFSRFYNKEGTKNGYWAEGVILYLYTLLDLESEENLKKAWKIVEEEQETLRYIPDYWFVCGIFYTNLVCMDPQQYIKYFPQIAVCYENCLKLGDKNGIVFGTGSFKALYNLGLYYETAGKKEEAINCYQKASKLGSLLADRQLSQLCPKVIKQQNTPII